MSRARPPCGYELPPEVSPINLTVRNIRFVVAPNDLAGDGSAADEVVEGSAGLQAAGPEIPLLVKADSLPRRPLKISEAHDTVCCLYGQAVNDRIRRLDGDDPRSWMGWRWACWC